MEAQSELTLVETPCSSGGAMHLIIRVTKDYSKSISRRVCKHSNSSHAHAMFIRDELAAEHWWLYYD
jgi:hypothetical protein